MILSVPTCSLLYPSLVGGVPVRISRSAMPLQVKYHTSLNTLDMESLQTFSRVRKTSEADSSVSKSESLVSAICNYNRPVPILQKGVITIEPEC